LLHPTSGTVRIFDLDIAARPDQVRRILGVVFQHPSLDKKLTVRENLLHQGHLYNLRGTFLHDRITEMLSRVGVLDRADELVEHLSGGLQRRVELAKAVLHRPRLLILDEPSTGLDPGARRDFDSYLQELRTTDGVTVLLTTHILSEAEHCDRLGILDTGSLVALGTPLKLKQEIGGDIISVSSKEPGILAESIRKYFNATPQVMDGILRIERNNGHEFIPELIQAFPGKIESVTLSKPSLEDVFIHKTGHRFWEHEPE
jgi:ABC-2 type transport system ATP-binding protein